MDVRVNVYLFAGIIIGPAEFEKDEIVENNENDEGEMFSKYSYFKDWIGKAEWLKYILI